MAAIAFDFDSGKETRSDDGPAPDAQPFGAPVQPLAVVATAAEATTLVRRLVRFLLRWRMRRLTIDELSALDDRMLADIGISRAEIPMLVDRAMSRQAANDND